MGLFRKKSDPISERSRALSDEIAALEAQIKALNQRLENGPHPPKWRSTTLPNGTAQSVPSSAPSRDPVFERLERRPIESNESLGTPAHYNDLGVRKYDLVAAWNRLKNHFRGPMANNPRLVSYLAAGSIKGLRPLRYEKRVARNRVIALLVVLLLFLWGVVAAFLRNF